MNYGSMYGDTQSRLGDASWVFVLKSEGSIGVSQETEVEGYLKNVQKVTTDCVEI